MGERNVKNLILGFGKAGKTLAYKLARKGEQVVLVEQSELMYGGTCINIGCIPSKLLLTLSEQRNESNLDAMSYYNNAIAIKQNRIAALRNKNLHKVVDLDSAEVLTGRAKFISDKTVEVKYINGMTDTINAERIFINTGATPKLPEVPGLHLGKFVYDTEALMDLDKLPDRLMILGGGLISAEFATTYAQFGSKVTIIQNSDTFLPTLERSTATAVFESLTELGVEVKFNTTINEVVENSSNITLNLVENNTPTNIIADALLVAIGRQPNIKNLGLENTNIITTKRGAIEVDDMLKTSVDNVWALGDVRGGPQFTYISLDDHRIILNQLFGDMTRSIKEQVNAPSTIFLNPPLANIGINEDEAKARGIKFRVATVPVITMPKAHVLGNTVGFYKALVGDDDLILGATIFAVEAQEVINIISTAMHNKLPYQTLRDQIFTHPTMAEGLNDLFEAIN